jgi:hypothetical protein
MAIIEENSSGAFIIITAVVVVGLIAALVFTKFMLNQTRARMLAEATVRHEKIAEINDRIENENVKAKGKYDDPLAEKNVMTTSGGSGIELEEYKQQYNANEDFAIFQTKNDAVGGVMGLQQKLNLADSITEKSVSMNQS